MEKRRQSLDLLSIARVLITQVVVVQCGKSEFWIWAFHHAHLMLLAPGNDDGKMAYMTKAAMDERGMGMEMSHGEPCFLGCVLEKSGSINTTRGFVILQETGSIIRLFTEFSRGKRHVVGEWQPVVGAFVDAESDGGAPPI